MIALPKLLDLAEQQARRVLIGGKQQILPTFLLVQPGDRMTVISVPFDDEGTKSTVAFVMRRVMKSMGVIAYSFLSEAWMATQNHPFGKGDLEPRHREDRQEIVMALASDGLTKETRHWEIIRADDTSCSDLKLLGGLDVVSGRFADLLD